MRGLGLKREVSTYLGEIDAREINSIPIGAGSDGQESWPGSGRYGPYLQRGEDRVSIPEDLAPDELTVERAEALLAAPSSDRVLGEDPETGLTVQVAGRTVRPLRAARRAGRGRAQAPDLVAVRVHGTGHAHLRAGPRPAAHPAGASAPTPRPTRRSSPTTASSAPISRRGTDTRSLITEDQILSVTVDEAVALFAQPKTRGGRTAKGPLREMGNDPDTGLTMVVKDGRFGPYVTDGTTNASLRRGDDVGVPDRRAGRRAAGRAPGGRAVDPEEGAAKKAPAKKAAAKKAAAKKAAAKKAPAKKAPAKKAPAPEGRGQGGAPGRAATRTGSPTGERRSTGSPDRPRGDRRLRQVHPGPPPGGPAGRHPDLRARSHQARGAPCGRSCSTGASPRSTSGPRPCSWRPTGPSTSPRWSMPALDGGRGW